MGIRVCGETPRAWQIDFTSVGSDGSTFPEQGQRVLWLSPSGDIVAGSFDQVWIRNNGKPVDYDPAYWAPFQHRPGEDIGIRTQIFLGAFVVLVFVLAVLGTLKHLFG